jgi:hypothetical protein
MTSASPRLRVEAACQQLGRDDFISRCVAMLAGGEEEPDFLVAIGGAPALYLLSQGIPRDQRYWLRVWATRGMLWAGRPTDGEVLRTGLEDASWRVREMTCKVIARHYVDELLDEMIALEVDPVIRVQTAAARAARRIVEGP